jgi:dihydrolipoamide dehydrogenase
MEKFDVLVLGGGLAGVSAALKAAELGGKVCLIEKDVIGRAGFLRRNALHLKGQHSTSVSWVEYKAALDSEIKEYCRVMREKLDAVAVVIIEGEGRLAGRNEVSIQKSDGETLLLKGKSIILAYGSSSRFPSTLPREDGVVIAIDEISQLKELPGKILVIGSSRCATETALGLQQRGRKVFLCSEQTNLISGLDTDFNSEIERQLKERKIKILAGKKLISFYKTGDELGVTLETGIKFLVDQIIIAGDRSGLKEVDGLEKIGIRLGENQKIFVDEGMMTSLPGVYAIGSITGELTSDTRAQEEGKIAAENSLGKKRKLNPEWVPQTIRLYPDIAYVGCNMATAGHQGFHPVEGVFERESNASADSSCREKFKVVADKRSRLIVGVQLISSQSSDWISMILLLIKKGVTVGNLANSTYPEGAGINGLCEAAKKCLHALKPS